MKARLICSLICSVSLFVPAVGCRFFNDTPKDTRMIVDQLDRKVTIPVTIKKIAALHHFGGKIVYALGQQHLLVEKSLYGKEAEALNRADARFAALPNMVQGHGYNVEGLAGLGPDIVFSYASMDRAELERFENAGIPAIAVKGETFEESFEAILLMSDVLGCRPSGERYINACRQLTDMVQSRLKGRGYPPVKVMFAGPKSIYSVATGNMLQSQILSLSGAVNVAEDLTGFWADVSPEQIAKWNPDVIFLGSYRTAEGREKILENPHFQTISAIKNKQIYPFPSNIGWWDYPAPHCVLGVVWSAKTLYPHLFEDINVLGLANEFYQSFVGYSFEDLGGHLD